MTCYRPIEAWQLEDSSICFKEPKNSILRELELPCGRCIGCRVTKQREWATRCMHEAQMHQENTFITLTYEGQVSPSLNYTDYQRFMYRVRAARGPTRFFMCGEYGPQTQRPHFHALLFGQWIGQRELEKLWTHGMVTADEVNYQRAAYVASYTTKKITGERAKLHYARVDTSTGECVNVRPEFARMSLKPGIGATWWHKYWRETAVPRDAIILQGGRAMPTPRYYDKMLEQEQPEIRERLDFERDKTRQRTRADRTRARLRDREKIEEARQRMKRRDKI